MVTVAIVLAVLIFTAGYLVGSNNPTDSIKAKIKAEVNKL